MMMIMIMMMMMMRFISILRVCKIAAITHTEPLANICNTKIPADEHPVFVMVNKAIIILQSQSMQLQPVRGH
jgi:hypothetical protein